MDLEKIKKNSNWNPSEGDYSKNHVSYERRMEKKKHRRKLFFLILYILILIACIFIFYKRS